MTTNLTDQQILAFSENFLSNERYRTYNVFVAKELGDVTCAIILNDMLDQYRYLKKNKKLLSHEKYGEGLMFYTNEQAWERCAVKKDYYDSSIRILERFGFLDRFKFGIPCKNYFRINELEIARWLFSNNVSSCGNSHNKKESFPQQEGVIPTTIYTIPIDEPQNKNNCLSVAQAHEEKSLSVCLASPSSEDEAVINKDSAIKQCTKRHPDGSEFTISIEEVYTLAVQRKTDWESSEIETAWEILSKKNQPIRDPFAFIDGTIKNLRTKKQNSKQESKKCTTQQQNKKMKPLTEPSKISENKASAEIDTTKPTLGQYLASQGVKLRP